MSYITELGMRGYTTQFQFLGTYRLSLILPPPYLITANFTIISVPVMLAQIFLGPFEIILISGSGV